jgi:hypothetical protein
MAITKIQSESLNLSDNYDFTGTVTGAGGANTPFFQAKVSSQTVSANTETLLQFDTEVIDSDSCYDNSGGNYKFQPNVAGYYHFSSAIGGTNHSNQVYSIFYKKNGSTNLYVTESTSFIGYTHSQNYIEYMNGTTDYMQCWCYFGLNKSISSSSIWSAYKIIE